ncbi:hypothetical protein HDE_07857 [Halotydeus destructor]|nr:hypothetical protein HDE_07857 [Halotydeus destructor]
MTLGHIRANCTMATAPIGITAHGDEFLLYTPYGVTAVLKSFDKTPELSLNQPAEDLKSFNNFTSVVYDGKDVYYLHGQGACFLNESLGVNCTQRPFEAIFRYKDPSLTPLAATQFRDGPFFLSLGMMSSDRNIMQITTNKKRNPVSTLSPGSSYNKNNTPSAIQWLHSEGDLDILLVFFQDIVGIHEVDLLNFNQPIVINATNVNYRSSSDWLGCEPEFCFDATVDGASDGIAGTLRLYHGEYIWTIDGERVSVIRGLFHNLDAVFYHNGQTYHFKDGDIVTTGDIFTPHPISKYFKNRDQPVEAAFHYNNLTWLINDGTYVAYQFSNSIFTEYSGANYSMFQSLPLAIDGAAVYEGRVHFFSDNFHYLRSDNEHSGDAMLTQKFAKSDCNSRYYQQSNQAKLLGIRNKQQFRAYRLRFKPEIEVKKTEMAPPKPPRKAPLDKMQIFLVGVVAVLLLLVFSLLVFKTFKTVDFSWKSNSLQPNTITQVTDSISQDKREPKAKEPKVEEPKVKEPKVKEPNEPKSDATKLSQQLN